MTVWLVIPPGDLELSSNPVTGKVSFVLIKGAPAVRQKIASRLKFFLGEWFLDTRLGMPYYRDVYGQGVSLDVIRSLIRACILSVPEVAAITKLTLTHDVEARAVAIEFNAQLVEGGVLAVAQPDLPFILSLQRAA